MRRKIYTLLILGHFLSVVYESYQLGWAGNLSLRGMLSTLPNLREVA